MVNSYLKEGLDFITQDLGEFTISHIYNYTYTLCKSICVLLWQKCEFLADRNFLKNEQIKQMQCPKIVGKSQMNITP